MFVRRGGATHGHFDPEIISHIDRIGVHPFVVVRSKNWRNSKTNFIVCQTQNDAADFLQAVGKLPRFLESKLVRGVFSALQDDPYDAAELFFFWVTTRSGVNENAFVGLPDGQSRSWFYGYPVFQIGGPLRRAAAPEAKIETLIALFESYDRTDGNNQLRLFMVEALGLGLSRSLGAAGRFEEAYGFVGRALTHSSRSFHLKAASHALQLHLSGQQVPDRLVKFIGHDNGYLKQFICPHPFENFEINNDGDVLTCAGPWISTGIGNFLTDPVDSIVNSKAARDIRKSVVAGTYKFCNHLECLRMIQGNLPKREDIEKTPLATAIARPDHRVDGVKEMVYAFDKTCNLSCPSCRVGLIADSGSMANQKIRAIEQKLPQLLPTLRSIQVNASGELFASKSSRRMLELIEDGSCPDLRLDIISNATLFTEQEWNKYPGIHGKIRSVRISTDAACKPTFEKLRRGGAYETFLENVNFISGLRAKGFIPILKFSFTYQAENFHEMREFVDFCSGVGADFVLFERLLNLVFSHQEYREKAVHLAGHPEHEEFLGIVRDPIFRSWRVWHDFEFPGVENLPPAEAKRRLELVAKGWPRPSVDLSAGFLPKLAPQSLSQFAAGPKSARSIVPARAVQREGHDVS